MKRITKPALYVKSKEEQVSDGSRYEHNNTLDIETCGIPSGIRPFCPFAKKENEGF